MGLRRWALPELQSPCLTFLGQMRHFPGKTHMQACVQVSGQGRLLDCQNKAPQKPLCLL